MPKSNILFFIVLIILSFASCSNDEATGPPIPEILCVRADGTGDCPNIQAAVDSISDGGIIELENGLYRGDGNHDIDLRGKAITICSKSGIPDSCVIKCSEYIGHHNRAFEFQSGERLGTVIENLKLLMGTGGSLPYPMRQPIPGEGKIATSGGFLLFRHASGPTIRNCIFSEGFASSGAVFVCYEGSYPSFKGCTFVDNYADDCLFVCWDASFTLENSLVAYNPCGVVYNFYYGEVEVLLSCCNLFGNWRDWIGPIESQYGVDGNISKDPLFADIEAGDFTLMPESPCFADSSSCGHIGVTPQAN